MSIQKTLFNANAINLTNATSLKTHLNHLNNLFKTYSGNNLRDSKLKEAFADFFGFNKSNTIDAILKSKQIDSGDKLFNIIKNELTLFFPYPSAKITSTIDDITIRIPVVILQTEDDRIFSICIDCTIWVEESNNLSIRNELFFYDETNNQYMDILDKFAYPSNFSTESIDIYTLIKAMVDYELPNKPDPITQIKIHSEITNVLGYKLQCLIQFNETELLRDVSTSIIKDFTKLVFGFTQKEATMYNAYTATQSSLKSVYHIATFEFD
jgi:hypothetical protein